MNNNELKCPYCGYTGEDCDFPDYFYEADEDYPEQYEYQVAIQKAGYNIVTCGQCGDVFIQKLNKENC